MSWLYGHTGYSFVDYWTLSHLAFWFVVGSTLAAIKIDRGLAMLCCLAGAFSWEVFERFAERLWPTVWLSPESLWNAFASDMLTCVVALLVSWWGFDKWRPK